MAYNRSRENYNQFVSRSTRGVVYKSGSRNRPVSRERYNNLKDAFHKRTRNMLLAGITVGALSVGLLGPAISNGISNVTHGLSVNHQILETSRDFRDTYIVPNTHRTLDGLNHYYDYYGIYDGLNEFGDGDFDLNVYYCLEALESYNTSKVLDCDERYAYHVVVGTDEYGNEITETRSLRNYLYQKGFYQEGEQMLDDKAYERALENYRTYMRDRLIVLDRINDTFTDNRGRLDDLNDDLFVMDEEHNIYNSKGGK